jgi:5-methylphenazine-1-carboxylate 1-monooxygenase
MQVAIIGGGICGLTLALNLKERGIACRVYERAPEIRELGVGITLLPHAMREFTTLGVGGSLLKAGIENRDCAFFNRFGQLIFREDRGKFAGYPFPEVGIHRGRLHVILYEAVLKRLGRDSVLTDRECTGIEQDDAGVTIQFKQTTN